MSKLTSISFILLFLNALWGFLLTKTTFAKPSYVVLLCLVLMLLFGVCMIRKGRFSTIRQVEVMLWLPYLIYTIGGYGLQGNLQFIVYWFIPISILFMSSEYSLPNYIPIKLILISAFISSAGVICQLLFPSIQESVSSIYVNDHIEKWFERDTGCAGFTYQLAATSALIFMGISILFCLFSEMKKRNMKYILFFVLYVTLFLAGKRMYFVMAIIIPIIVNYFSLENKEKLSKMLIYAFVLFLFSVIVVNNLDTVSNIPGMKRVADLISAFETDDDITSSRAYLWEIALQMYQSSPLFGIGLGNFIASSDMEMDIHNTYLSVLCEQGIVGLFFYLVPIIVCLHSTIVMLKSTSNLNSKIWLKFSLFIQLYYVLYSFTGNTNSSKYCYQFYFVAVAILVYYKYYHYEDINISSQSY